METTTMMRRGYPEVIYPDVFISVGVNITITTTLRMEHEGKWYLCNFLQSHSNTETLDSVLLDRLHKEVYKMKLLGKVNLNLVDVFGDRVFRLDDNQESEVERISKLVKKMEL